MTFSLTRHEIKFTARTCKGLCILAVASLVAHDNLQKEVLVVLHGSVYFSYRQCGCRVPKKGESMSALCPAAGFCQQLPVRGLGGAVQKGTLPCIVCWVQMLIEPRWFTSNQTLLFLFVAPHQLVIRMPTMW